MKDYLFYARYCMSGLYVYHCKTDDPFHVMGEMTYRCFEHIDRLDFVEQTESKLEFWNKEGYKIREWENKYNKNKDMLICATCEYNMFDSKNNRCAKCADCGSHSAIERLKTEDVQPVVHSKWEISSDGYYPYCKRCKARPPEMTKYCPSCGARMDGD